VFMLVRGRPFFGTFIGTNTEPQFELVEFCNGHFVEGLAAFAT
jgi:hypothetical protein